MDKKKEGFEDNFKKLESYRKSCKIIRLVSMN